jgi:hypothetical protein
LYSAPHLDSHVDGCPTVLESNPHTGRKRGSEGGRERGRIRRRETRMGNRKRVGKVSKEIMAGDECRKGVAFGEAVK